MPAAVVGVVVVAAVLVWWGSEAILSSTGGTLLRTIDDPAQPGFEALVEPTPVMAVIATGDDGALGSVSLLSRTGEDAGAVVVVAPRTLAPAQDGSQRTLAESWALEGASGVRAGLGAILNVGIAEDRVVDPAQWATLIEPIGGLRIDNPDPVTFPGPDGQPVRFPAGSAEVVASQVGAYLAASSPGESDLARLVRLQRFWAAWLSSVGAAIADPGVIPGEADSGLGLFVRTLAGVEVELTALPVVPEAAPAGGENFRPVADEVALLVSRLVPFPVGASPDSRLRVRILDGTGQLDNGLPAAPPLVAAGSEVATVGNATRFDYATTQFIVPPGVDEARVAALREALQFGDVVASAESASAVDVTVVLGLDAVSALGGPYPPPTIPGGSLGG